MTSPSDRTILWALRVDSSLWNQGLLCENGSKKRMRRRRRKEERGKDFDL